MVSVIKTQILRQRDRDKSVNVDRIPGSWQRILIPAFKNVALRLVLIWPFASKCGEFDRQFELSLLLEGRRYCRDLIVIAVLNILPAHTF